MTRLGIFAVAIIASLASASGLEVRAAEPKAPASAPRACVGLEDFVETNCQLTWYGITVYGTIDVGGGWMSHGAPWDSADPTWRLVPDPEVWPIIDVDRCA